VIGLIFARTINLNASRLPTRPWISSRISNQFFLDIGAKYDVLSRVSTRKCAFNDVATPFESCQIVKMANSSDLGQNIQNLRKKARLTQEELAGMANIATRVLQRIEAGKANPKVATLAAISKGLGISLEDLFSSGSKAKLSHVQLSAIVSNAREMNSLELASLIVPLFEVAPEKVRALVVWALTGNHELLARWPQMKALLAKAI
jgi:transcriptional regulator with XRE-family HTH domain